MSIKIFVLAQIYQFLWGSQPLNFLSLIFLFDIQFISYFPVRILNAPLHSLENFEDWTAKVFLIFLNTLNSTWQHGNPSYFWVLNFWSDQRIKVGLDSFDNHPQWITSRGHYSNFIQKIWIDQIFDKILPQSFI